MRIVSLLASATEIVCALGLEDRLVGISHECDHPPQILHLPRLSRPRFDPDGMTSGEVDSAVRRAAVEHGSVYEIDGDLLEELRPDLILSQAVCDVCAVPTAGVADLVRRRGLSARVVSLDAHSLEQILHSILVVGRAGGVEGRAADRIGALRERLAHVRAAVSGLPRPRVLGLEWLDPPFAPGHWVPEMIEWAGGRNLLGEPGAPSRQVAWDELGQLDPDILLVMPCGYGVERAQADADAQAERLRAVAPRAVAAARARVVDASSYFNRSGPRVVAGIELLAGIFHPELGLPTPSDAVRPWPGRGRP
ncbi:MAG: cobalamin-binding protein [Gemmatimonadota bacterium]